MRSLRGGRTALELEDRLRNLVKQVSDTNKPGSMTITLTVEPGGGNRIRVRDKIGETLPKQDRDSTLFFAEEDYSLSRQMPGQVSLSVLEGME